MPPRPPWAALIDAARVVFATQREAGIDLPTDGELYRFDVNQPDTNGMIDYFVRRLGGMHGEVGREDGVCFRAKQEMRFRRHGPAGARARVRLRATGRGQYPRKPGRRTIGGGGHPSHPDCGFWMLKRSVADRKLAALVQGRNLYLGLA